MDVAASEFYKEDKTYDLNFKEEVCFSLRMFGQLICYYQISSLFNWNNLDVHESKFVEYALCMDKKPTSFFLGGEERECGAPL